MLRRLRRGGRVGLRPRARGGRRWRPGCGGRAPREVELRPHGGVPPLKQCDVVPAGVDAFLQDEVWSTRRAPPPARRLALLEPEATADGRVVGVDLEADIRSTRWECWVRTAASLGVSENKRQGTAMPTQALDAGHMHNVAAMREPCPAAPKSLLGPGQPPGWVAAGWVGPGLLPNRTERRRRRSTVLRLET